MKRFLTMASALACSRAFTDPAMSPPVLGGGSSSTRLDSFDYVGTNLMNANDGSGLSASGSGPSTPTSFGDFLDSGANGTNEMKILGGRTGNLDDAHDLGAGHITPS